MFLILLATLFTVFHTVLGFESLTTTLSNPNLGICGDTDFQGENWNNYHIIDSQTFWETNPLSTSSFQVGDFTIHALRVLTDVNSDGSIDYEDAESVCFLINTNTDESCRAFSVSASLARFYRNYCDEDACQTAYDADNYDFYTNDLPEPQTCAPPVCDATTRAEYQTNGCCTATSNTCTQHPCHCT